MYTNSLSETIRKGRFMSEANSQTPASDEAKPILPACPVETTLTLISNRWRILILRDLMDGPHRFGELKKSIGAITQKVLTANLRSMEECGLLTRTVFPEVPPHVEYELTELGYSLKPILDSMQEWGAGYKRLIG